MDLKQRVAKMLMNAATALSAEAQAFASAVLDSGQTIQTDAEEWAVGVAVFVVNDEGEQIPLPDGDYTLDSGVKFVVAEGAVAEWMEPEAEEATKDETEVEAAAEVLTREDVAQMIADAIQGVQASFEARLAEKEQVIENLAKQPAAKGVERVAKRNKVNLAELASLSETERVRILMANS
jgi:hypothetical protein